MSLEIEVASFPRTEVMPVRTGSSRARRRFAGRLKRLLRWEFWPAWVFYPPVILYIAYLGLRFRSLTIFTAANPGIPAAGFVGESKFQILENLKEEFVPCSALLREGSLDARMEQA